MLVIGMCGGSGSGKGTVCALFEERGIPSIDTDAVYHEITSRRGECLDELAERFGDGILKADGSLDRRVLSDIVFSSVDAKENKKALEEISHKHILSLTRSRLSEYADLGYFAAIVDAPLLFESGFDRECDKIIAVIAEESLRISRIMARDGLSFERARARISSQLPDSALTERADFVVENNGSLEQLYRQVDLIIKILKNDKEV